MCMIDLFFLFFNSILRIVTLEEQHLFRSRPSYNTITLFVTSLIKGTNMIHYQLALFTDVQNRNSQIEVFHETCKIHFLWEL